jgi:hypothetical protein
MQNQTDFKSWTRVQWRSLNPNQFNFEGWNRWKILIKKLAKTNNKKNEDKIWEKKNMREDEIKKKKNTILKMISNKINNN